jgi:Na+/H+ antiporter NhaD/arsenite permease-like protein
LDYASDDDSMIVIAGLPLSIIVLIAVFVLIAVRQVGKVKLRIWQVMLGGAVAVLLTGEISPLDAASAVNVDVMLFLLGMFIVGEALYESGYLSHLSYRLFKRARSVDQLILLILFGFGFLSAFLMNDTLAIIGTPMMIYFAKRHRTSPKLLMLALAIAVTTGSVLSPIGNPQNLLIALNGGMTNPFVTFFRHLAIPTIINLFIAYLILRWLFKSEFKSAALNHQEEPITSPRLAMLSKISLILIFILISLKIAFVFLGVQIDLRLTYIALIAAAPIVLFGKERATVVRNIDWSTLVFFIAMFVLMGAVWNSGFLQSNMTGIEILSIPIILVVSVILSQFISNVPFVALYLPLMTLANAPDINMVALAAGSTIAGNMLILGAASNVIIVQNAEKRGETIKFLEFARVGVPLTIINILVYWVCIVFI